MGRRGRVNLWARRVLRPLETARILAPQLLPERLRSGLKMRFGRALSWLGASKVWKPGHDELAGLHLPEDGTTGPASPAFGKQPLSRDAHGEPPDVLARRWPKVSILIVSHGNPQLTRLCLDSVFGWTRYPSFEVIVVDNGSGSSTRQTLEEMSGRFEDLTVVFNADNRGFAAASNQAAAMATGEILCLLNNDTIVTPGWLSVLATALQSDRRLGLVGPVSNGVANEARVQTSYIGIEELRDWAEEWVRRHDGEEFAIPMLALFCAVIRREVWDEVGPLDEGFGLGMFEDDDYCRRLRRAGYDLTCRRDSYVHHWQQASFGQLDHQAYLELYERNQRYFRDKWADDRG